MQTAPTKRHTKKAEESIEPILPDEKQLPISDFICAKCQSIKSIHRKGVDHIGRVLDIVICKQCGTPYIKYQDQFVKKSEKMFVRY